MDIVGFVAERLGIEPSQAKCALGLLLNFAKSRLGDERFAQLIQYVPGADDLMPAAPEKGGLTGALGGIASALGGESAGSMADLAGGLSKAGLKADDMGSLVSAVTSFFQESGQEDAVSLVQEAMK